jgi:hypothetical protein
VTAINTAELLPALDRVLGSGLTTDVRNLGNRLRHRLVTCPAIAVIGHAESGADRLCALLAREPGLIEVELVPIQVDSRQPAAQLADELADLAPYLALWHTTGFTPTDQQFWSRVPQALRDQSFLVLADPVHNAAAASGTVNDAENLTDEFRGIFPVHLQEASDPDSQGRQSGLPACARGISALVDAICRQIILGQSALRDNLDYFLSRYAAVDAPAIPAALDNMHAILAEKAKDIPRLRDLPVALRASAVLSHCSESLDAIIPLSSGLTGPLSEDILEAADSLVLMQIEGGNAAASDALSLLLQLRREIAADR